MRKLFHVFCFLLMISPFALFSEDSPEWVQAPDNYGKEHFGGEKYHFFSSIGEGKNSTESVKNAIAGLKFECSDYCLSDVLLYRDMIPSFGSKQDYKVLGVNEKKYDLVLECEDNFSILFDSITDKIEVLEFATHKDEDGFYVTYTFGRILRSDVDKFKTTLMSMGDFYEGSGTGFTKESAIENARMDLILNIIKENSLKIDGTRMTGNLCSEFYFDMRFNLEKLMELYVSTEKLSDYDEIEEKIWTAEIIGCIPSSCVDSYIERLSHDSE
ncbi:MAG: hypothetical protein J6Y16_06160 [Treponema sp.]|nr:hypothetical protein [Treponema sp.]